MTFAELGVAPSLLSSLEQMNISEPLPIQQVVIPAALRGENLLVTSQTGSGKTLSFLIPLLQQLQNNRAQRAIILAPTRELAQQIGAVCTQLNNSEQVTSTVIVGGVEYAPQRAALATSPNIIIATPGRLIDLIEQGVSGITEVEHFILDEVDQMLDLGFRNPISTLAQLRSNKATTLCFTATLSDDVASIAKEIIPSATPISIDGATMVSAKIQHFGYYVSFAMMDRLLIHLLHTENAQQAIIFTRSRKMADRIVGLLSENSIAAEAMHSDRSQTAREHILSRFRSAETKIIVATDVIARGIDIDNISHVFNFGLPQSAEQYIHRCGRTGRAGRAGRSISLFTPEERPILNEICRLMKRHFTIDENHPYMTLDVIQALSAQEKPTNTAKKSKRRGRHA